MVTPKKLWSAINPYSIFLWVVFFSAWYLLRVDDFPDKTVAVKVTLLKVAVLAFLLHVTNNLLIPSLLYKKRYTVFGWCFTCLIIAAGWMKIYLILRLLQPYFQIPLKVFSDVKARFYDDIIPLFLLVSTGAAGKLVMDYLRTQNRLAAVTRQRAEAELQYLRSQLNPHFVFNTLNTIYFQIDKQNHDARESLLQFSGLLRYQLYECTADKIDIGRELAYLEDYIQLQKKRLNENYTVDFLYTPQVSGFSIEPLLLAPFIENAFKHISNFANQPNTICIKADLQQGAFMFDVVNSTENAQGSKGAGMGGIGLKNVQRRLDLLYAEKHTLAITKPEGFFKVHLMIMI